MEKELDHYLSTIDNHLRNMPISERIDIIKELKAYIEELQNKENLTSAEIIQKMGSTKELAAGYLGTAISCGTKINTKKISMLITFYGLTSLSGMFVLPFCSILSVSLYFAAIISPIAGLIKSGGFLLGIDVPFIMFNFGFFELHSLLVFPTSFIIGLIFFFAGKFLWKLMLGYIQSVSNIKKTIDT